MTLVVLFLAFLDAAMIDSNFLFLKLAENTASEADFVLVARPTNRSTSPFLNETVIRERLDGQALVGPGGGTAARWLALGEVSNTKNRSLKVTSTIIVVDSAREKQVGMGRMWGRRPLGKQEAYVSSTICASLGVEAKQGQRLTLSLDLVEIALSLLGDSAPDESLGEEAVVKQLLEDLLGLDFSQSIVLDSVALTQATLAAAQGAQAVSAPGSQQAVIVGLVEDVLRLLGPVLPAETEINLQDLFDQLYPLLRSAIRIEEEFIVLDSVPSPSGKWPYGIGNVMVMELDDAHRLLRQAASQVLEIFQPFSTPAEVSPLNASSAGDIAGINADNAFASGASLLESLASVDLYEYAMQVTVQASERRYMYTTDVDAMYARVTAISDLIVGSLPANMSVEILTPVANAVSAFQFIRLFLDTVFNSVIFLLTLLGCLVIYALMIGNVETKTYEYGMLRALGMTHKTLTDLLSVQAFSFAVTGIVFGMSIAGLLHLPLALIFADFSGLDIPFRLPDHAIALGCAVGVIMPIVANVVPVRRALSNTLRDALDLYRKAASEIKVKLQSLASLGLSPGLFAMALMMSLIGFTTFYFLPLSFVFGQLGLFLGILNGILLGILLGLSLLSQMIQPLIEHVLLRMAFFMLPCVFPKEDACLQGIIKKNLYGHRSRNRKVSYLLTIAIAFLIFAGALFALQIKVIGISVSQILGADISMTSLDRAGSKEDEDGNPLLTGLPVEKLNAVLNNSARLSEDNGVEQWTYVSYPLDDMPFVGQVRIGSASLNPSQSSKIYGLESNFLDVAYNDYVILNGLNGGGSANDVIKDLNNGKDDIMLPGDEKNDQGNSLPITLRRRGTTPTCTSKDEGDRLFVYCPNGGEVITRVHFADFGQPTGICTQEGTQGNSNSRQQPKHPFTRSKTCNLGDDVDDVKSYFSDRCLGRSSCGSEVSSNLFGDPCPGKKKWLSLSVQCSTRAELDESKPTRSGDAIIVEPQQPAYIEGILSSALTDFCSININTPFRIKVVVRRNGVDVQFSLNLGGKPRAFASKMPGFLFSSYQVLARNAPLLIPMDQYAYLAFRTFDYAEQLKSYSNDMKEKGGNDRPSDGSPGLSRSDNNSTTSTLKNSSSEDDDTSNSKYRPNPYTSPGAIPKQRLLVRMRSDATAEQRQILQNALTAVVGSGVSATFSSLVVDTKSLIDETEVANAALTLFLNIIAVIIMILCFLVNLVSFAANVNDNAREFAVLRALGLRSWQVIKIYITEAVVLVLSSFLLGSIIGILVAVSLTLQFNLFIESPFIFNFPSGLFLILAFLGIAVATAAAYFPAKSLIGRQISHVLKSG